MTDYAAAENKAVHLATFHARLEFSLGVVSLFLTLEGCWLV